VITSLNLDEETVRMLDDLAGPRGRSAWVRAIVLREHEANARLLKLLRRINAKQPGRKATTPRKKA
jgi:hypothetical protein